MKKQIWVKCKNNVEERELLSLLKGYQVDISSNKNNFPIVIDTQQKWVIRNTSISSCAIYVFNKNKILTLNEAKQILEKLG